MAKLTYYLLEEYLTEERLNERDALNKMREICEAMHMNAHYIYRDSAESDDYQDIVLFKDNLGQYVVRHSNDVRFIEYDEAVSLFFDMLIIGYGLSLECSANGFTVVMDFDW